MGQPLTSYIIRRQWGQPVSIFRKEHYKGVHMSGQPPFHDNWFTFYRRCRGGPDFADFADF